MTRNGGGGRRVAADRLLVGDPDETETVVVVATATLDWPLRSESGLGERLSPRPRVTAVSVPPLQLLLPPLALALPLQGGDCCCDAAMELVMVAVEFEVTRERGEAPASGAY